MSSAPHSEGPEAKRPRHEGIVDLDVGGTPFRTTNMTLQKSPFFANLLDCEGEGPVFVDRCPQLFAQVLQYLRSGRGPRCATPAERDALAQEFDFFGLDESEVSLPEQVVLTEQYSWRKHKETRVSAKVKTYQKEGYQITHLSSFGGTEDVVGCTFVLER